MASWIGWAPEGDTLFFYEIPWDAPSGLFRHSLASGVSVELTQLQFSDPLLVEPPEGYEREYCDESFTPFSVRSQNELAVMARCYRERVTEVRGPNDYDTETVRRGWDVFSVIPTLNPVFNEVKNQPHKRVNMQSQQVTDCGTEAVCGETTDDDFELFPAWSSDGRQLAFLRKRRAVDDHDDLVANNLGKELFVADVYVDGSMSVRKLLELGENEGYIVNPTWSPGGDWIAFTLWSPSQQEGLGEIYIVRTDEGSGRPPRRVTKGIRTANTLSWRATTPLVLP